MNHKQRLPHFNPPLSLYSSDDFIAVLDWAEAEPEAVTEEARAEIEAEIARLQEITDRAVRSSGEQD